MIYDFSATEIIFYRKIAKLSKEEMLVLFNMFLQNEATLIWAFFGSIFSSADQSIFSASD